MTATTQRDGICSACINWEVSFGNGILGPPCPQASIQYDSYSATRTKCGFTEFTDPSTPPKIYLTSTTVATLSGSFSTTVDGNIAVSNSFSGSITNTETYDNSVNPCTTNTTCSGAQTVTSSQNTTYPPPNESLNCSGTFEYQNNCSGNAQDITTTGCGYGSTFNDSLEGYPCSTNIDQTQTTNTNTVTCTGAGGSYSLTTVDTLSSEYTTDSLKTNTEAAMSAESFPDTWTGGPAYYNLSSTEETLSLSTSQWRVKHKPSITCYLQVWIAFIFVPDDLTVEPIVISSNTTYTFTSTGNPCLNDSTQGINETANLIYSDATSITYSDVLAQGNGTIDVVIWKQSMLPDYTPDDPTFTITGSSGSYDYTLTPPSPNTNCYPEDPRFTILYPDYPIPVYY